MGVARCPAVVAGRFQAVPRRHVVRKSKEEEIHIQSAMQRGFAGLHTALRLCMDECVCVSLFFCFSCLIAVFVFCRRAVTSSMDVGRCRVCVDRCVCRV